MQRYSLFVNVTDP